ncbi:MAG: cation diffusion facilitator family transporter [candidate division Zixibacteria bacterium]|nr:cation diffusion facilitator family transporter [candidate division Zixibacteria bacterium]
MAANLGLMILKIWVGYFSRSQALIADGFHSLSDLAGDVIVIIGIKWGRKEADEDHPYGHRRIETFAGFMIGVLLIGIGIWIIVESVTAVYNNERSQASLATIFAAAVSIVIKEALYWYTVSVGKRIKSPAVIGNAWHHRTDALSSVAVLIGVAAVYFNPEWYLADSAAAIIVALLIIKVGYSISKSAFLEVVDTAPSPELIAKIEELAGEIDGADSVHDIKARSLGEEIYVEIHVVVNPELTVRQGHDIAKAVERKLIAEIAQVCKVVTHIDPE